MSEASTIGPSWRTPTPTRQDPAAKMSGRKSARFAVLLDLETSGGPRGHPAGDVHRRPPGSIERVRDSRRACARRGRCRRWCGRSATRSARSPSCPIGMCTACGACPSAHSKSSRTSSSIAPSVDRGQRFAGGQIGGHRRTAASRSARSASMSGCGPRRQARYPPPTTARGRRVPDCGPSRGRAGRCRAPGLAPHLRSRRRCRCLLDRGQRTRGRTQMRCAGVVFVAGQGLAATLAERQARRATRRPPASATDRWSRRGCRHRVRALRRSQGRPNPSNW